jgi:hypothetical protein
MNNRGDKINEDKEEEERMKDRITKRKEDINVFCFLCGTD